MLSDATIRTLISGLLAVIGGYADAVSIIRFGVFPATQTGNVIFVGRSLQHVVLTPREYTYTRHDVDIEELGQFDTLLFRIAVIVVSVLGAYVYACFERRQPQQTASRAAPMLAALVLLGDFIPFQLRDNGEGLAHPGARWSCLLVSFALGAVHYLCGTSDGSRLKAVTFAATGHLHKIVKTLHKLQLQGGSALKESERVSSLQSLCIFAAMIVGATLGSFTYHHTQVWLYTPVSLGLLVALVLHDRCLPPPAGWGVDPLREPLTVAAVAPAAAAGAVV